MSQQLDELHISDRNSSCQPGCSQTETSGGNEIPSGKCIQNSVSRLASSRPFVNQDEGASSLSLLLISTREARPRGTRGLMRRWKYYPLRSFTPVPKTLAFLASETETRLGTSQCRRSSIGGFSGWPRGRAPLSLLFRLTNRCCGYGASLLSRRNVFRPHLISSSVERYTLVSCGDMRPFTRCVLALLC